MGVKAGTVIECSHEKTQNAILTSEEVTHINVKTIRDTLVKIFLVISFQNIKAMNLSEVMKE